MILFLFIYSAFCLIFYILKEREMMITSKKKRRKPLVIILWIAVSIIILTATVFLIKKLFGDKGKEKDKDSYLIVMEAIEKTESMEDFFIQTSSTSKINNGKVSQQVVTNGYIYTLDKKEFVYVYANTESKTVGSAANDFNVTVSMYSDGTHVYDNSTGKSEIVEGITCDEFDKIVSEYELYKPKKEDVIKFTFNEDQNIKDGKSGDMIISLSRLDEKVIKSIKEALSQNTGEEVNSEKINILSATAIYSIYDGTVVSQSCSFSVNYAKQNGTVVKYFTETNINYLKETDIEDTSFISTEAEAQK